MAEMIPFIDLQAQQRWIRSQIDERIKAVLDHGKYIMGPEVFELEERLSSYVGVKHAISVASGTDALLMALMAYGVGPGDAIFTTPFTFIATAEVISLLGATPIFVDIHPRTFNIDPDKLEAELVSFDHPLKPKGVIPVDLFGLPADYDSINNIARKYDLFVLEDSAQGLGGIYKGRKAGSLAGVATTSFFPAKPLGCYGDGGAIFTDNDDVAEMLRSIRVHGQGDDKYDNVRIGVNGRLDSMQAAILLPKLDIFQDEIDARQEVARVYTQELRDLPNVMVPFVPEGYQSAWAQYSILVEGRDGLKDKLAEQNIPTAVYYPKPLHLQTAYSDQGYGVGDFPVAEQAASNIISLPMHPYQAEATTLRISFAIKKLVGQ